MMKRKLVMTVLVVLAALSCVFSFVACKKDKTPTNESKVELVTLESVELELGDSRLISVTVVDDAPDAQSSLSFSSANSSVVSVTDGGLLVSESVGSTTVEVAYKSVKKTILVRVVDSRYTPVISTPDVWGGEVKLYADEKFEIGAKVVFKDKTVDGASISYASSNAAVASVTDGGEVTALSQGTTVITLTSSYKTWSLRKTISVEVVSDVLVELTERHVELYDGDLVGGDTTRRLSVERVLVDGNVQSFPSVTWESRDEEIATVSESGEISAVSIGQTVIAACYKVGEKNYYGCVYVTVKHMQLKPVGGIEMSEDGVLSWNEVDYADRYVVGDGKEEFETIRSSIDLSEQGYYGSTEFYIVAEIDNTEVDDSERAAFEYVFKVKSLQSAVETLDIYEASTVVNVLPEDFTKDGAVYHAECNAKNITGAYGYNFKKISMSTDAAKDYGNSWCKNALFRSEDIRKYVGSQLSFWAYAEERTDFYYWKMDLYWARTLNAQVTIPAKTWTFVSFTIAESDFDYITCLSASGSFYYINMMVSDASYEGADYSGISNNIAQFTERKISALDFDGEIDLIEGQKLCYVETLCGLLSDSEKAQIASYTAFVGRLESFKSDYTVLKDMNTLSGIVEDSYSYGNVADYSISEDSDYGNVLSVKTYRGGNNVHAVFTYDCTDVDLTATDAVRFFVYNDGSEARNLLGKINGKLNTNIAKLDPKAWTEVVIPVGDFTASGCFGILNCQKDVEYKFSIMYAINLSALIDDANRKINAIGTVTKDSGESIAVAREAVDKLPENVRTTISGYLTLTAAETEFKVLAIAAAETDETVKAINKQIDDYRQIYGSLTSTQAISNLSKIISGRNAIRNAYKSLTLFQKAGVADYDESMNFDGYSVFEDYSSRGVLSGSSGWGGVIADNRTNVSEYGICASCGLGGGLKFYTITYNKKDSVPSEYAYVSFAVKNTRTANLKLSIINEAWSVVGSVLLEGGKTNEWNIVTIPMADFIAIGNMLRVDFDAAYDGGETNIWISPMIAHN